MSQARRAGFLLVAGVVAIALKGAAAQAQQIPPIKPVPLTPAEQARAQAEAEAETKAEQAEREVEHNKQSFDRAATGVLPDSSSRLRVQLAAA